MHLSEEIGARLQDERKRLGLNQEQAAALLGCSKRTQAAYEAGTSEAGMVYMSRAASAGLDVLYVVTGVRAPQAADSFSADEADLVARYRQLPPGDRAGASKMVTALAEMAGRYEVKNS